MLTAMKTFRELNMFQVQFRILRETEPRTLKETEFRFRKEESPAQSLVQDLTKNSILVTWRMLVFPRVGK